MRFLATIIVARTLGPTIAGLYAAVATAVEIGDRAFAFGRPDSLAFHVSSGEEPGGMLYESLRLLRKIGGLAAVFGLGLALIPALQELSWEIRVAAGLAVAAVPYTASAKSCWRETRLALGQSQRTAIGEAVRALLTLGFAVLAGAYGNELGGSVATVTLLLGLPLSELATRLYLRIPTIEIAERKLPPTFASFARAAYFASLAQPLNQRFDQLILLFLLSPAEIGLYASAVSLSLIVGIFGVGVAQAVYPRLSTQGGAHDTARKNVLRLEMLLLILIVPVAAAVLVSAPQLIEFAFGPRFAGAAQSTRILLIGAVITSVNIVGQIGLLSMGRPSVASRAQFFALFVQLVLLVPLASVFGIEGAALASVAGYAVRLGITLRGLFVASLSASPIA